MPISGQRWAFTKASVSNAIDRPGVYALFDGAELIYFGQSERSVRERLLRHLNGLEGRCTQGASSFVEEECVNPPVREAILLEEFDRKHGRLPRCNERVG
jgi:hypothetical protein